MKRKKIIKKFFSSFLSFIFMFMSLWIWNYTIAWMMDFNELKYEKMVSDYWFDNINNTQWDYLNNFINWTWVWQLGLDLNSILLYSVDWKSSEQLILDRTGFKNMIPKITDWELLLETISSYMKPAECETISCDLNSSWWIWYLWMAPNSEEFTDEWVYYTNSRFIDNYWLLKAKLDNLKSTISSKISVIDNALLSFSNSWISSSDKSELLNAIWSVSGWWSITVSMAPQVLRDLADNMETRWTNETISTLSSKAYFASEVWQLINFWDDVNTINHTSNLNGVDFNFKLMLVWLYDWDWSVDWDESKMADSLNSVSYTWSLIEVLSDPIFLTTKDLTKINHWSVSVWNPNKTIVLISNKNVTTETRIKIIVWFWVQVWSNVLNQIIKYDLDVAKNIYDNLPEQFRLDLFKEDNLKLDENFWPDVICLWDDNVNIDFLNKEDDNIWAVYLNRIAKEKDLSCISKLAKNLDWIELSKSIDLLNNSNFETEQINKYLKTSDDYLSYIQTKNILDWLRTEKTNYNKYYDLLFKLIESQDDWVLKTSPKIWASNSFSNEYLKDRIKDFLDDNLNQWQIKNYEIINLLWKENYSVLEKIFFENLHSEEKTNYFENLIIEEKLDKNLDWSLNNMNSYTQRFFKSLDRSYWLNLEISWKILSKFIDNQNLDIQSFINWTSKLEKWSYERNFLNSLDDDALEDAFDWLSILNDWDELKSYWLAWALWRICTKAEWEWDPLWRSSCVQFEEYEDYDPEDNIIKSQQEDEILKMYNRNDVYLYNINLINDEIVDSFHVNSDIIYKIWLMRWLDDNAFAFLESKNLTDSFISLTKDYHTIWDEDYNSNNWVNSTYLTWNEFTCFTTWVCN